MAKDEAATIQPQPPSGGIGSASSLSSSAEDFLFFVTGPWVILGVCRSKALDCSKLHTTQLDNEGYFSARDGKVQIVLGPSSPAGLSKKLV